MPRKIVLLLCMLVLTGTLYARNIRVGLFYNQAVQSIMITPVGDHILVGDGLEERLARGHQPLYVSVQSAGLVVRDTVGILGAYRNIRLESVDDSAFFRLKPMLPSMGPREYAGELNLSLGTVGIDIINILDFEDYLAGVVSVEAGPKATLEFYKVQVILCRNYIYANPGKHESENFDVCDEVHCQAYKGKTVSNDDIFRAVHQTRGMILVDDQGRPAHVPYHSNSGGQTASADEVWLKPEKHLIAVPDPFSEGQRNYSWTKEVSRDEWINYLEDQGIIPEAGAADSLMHFESPWRRKYYEVGVFRIEMARIREDWDLKSSFFNIIPRSDRIILEGKGYGHGVGLSQEGAMKMAEMGYFFNETLDYYYSGLKIVRKED